MRISKAALPSAIVIAFLLPMACGNDKNPTQCPGYQVGAIEGFVRGGGLPVPGTQIRAIPLDPPDSQGFLDDTRFRVDDDSTGHYRMDLPSGTYMLSLYGPGESRGGSQLGRFPDTVRVGTSARRYDLNKGRVEITVYVPAFMEGRSVEWLGPVTTVENGMLHHVLPLVQPEEIELGLRLGAMELWLPGTVDESRADRIAVATDAPTRYAADLSRMAEITGAVHGSWETIGAYSTPVMAFGADSVLVAEALSSSSDGSFVLDVFPPQPVRLAAGMGWKPQLWLGGYSYGTATEYDLQPGGQTAGVDILECGIRCRLDWPDPDAVGSAGIRLIDPWNRQIDVSHWVFDGRLVVTTLPAGRYFLQVYHGCQQKWAPVWYGGSETPDGATPIDIGWGQVADVTVTLYSGGRIHGTIDAFDGSPPGLQRILLYDSIGTLLCSGSTDRTTDEFDFTGLDNGSYRLAVSEDWGSLWWYPGTADPDSARLVTIADHDSVSGVEWRLPR